MVSDELKPKKRIRHKFNKSELYHRFVNSEEYAYCAGKKLTCKYDYISICDIGENSSRRNIQDCWCLNKNRIIAIIDRLNKEIIISRQYPEHSNNVRYALPNDYTIWYCDGPIPKYNILSMLEREALYKLHLKHIAGVYFNHVYGSFFAVKHGKKVLHYDIDNLSDGYGIYTLTNIKNIVKKYNIDKYDWYVKPLNEKFNIDIYYPNNLGWCTTILPSLKTLISKKVFSNKDKDIFRKRYFYTKYCFGRYISFKDVDTYFNKDVDKDFMTSYFNNIYTSWSDFRPNFFDNNKLTTWNDYIVADYEIDQKQRKNYIDKQIAKSNENRLKAIGEITNDENPIISFRNNAFVNRRITYKRYFTPRKRHDWGKWSDWTETIYNNINLPNTQLRLQGNNIITSRHASVSLKEGIYLFKWFCKFRKIAPKQISFTCNDFGTYKIGIYSLISIWYRDKYTDAGVNLNKKEWQFKIGCHTIWLDDIIDFIHYYHLEDKFGLDEETFKSLDYGKC